MVAQAQLSFQNISQAQQQSSKKYESVGRISRKTIEMRLTRVRKWLKAHFSGTFIEGHGLHPYWRSPLSKAGADAHKL
jgi:hypothetical protein